MMRGSVSLVLTLGVMVFVSGCREPAEDSDGDQSVVIRVDLQAATAARLPTCTSTLAGTTAYVTSPAGLWSCQSPVWIALPCTKLLAGAVAYASATQSLWACSAGQWAAVALPKGDVGPQGTMGVMGERGATGAAGPQGPSGAGVEGAACALDGETGVVRLTFAAGADPSAGTGTLTCVLPAVDPHHCRGVDVTTLPNAKGSCASRRPVILSCEGAFFDADGEAANGCETDLTALAAATVKDIGTYVVPDGAVVRLVDVYVTMIDRDGQSFWVADARAAAPYSGIYVYRGAVTSPLDARVVVGAKVTIDRAFVTTFEGARALTKVVNDADLTIVAAADQPVAIEPLEVWANDLMYSPDAAGYVGSLVHVAGDLRVEVRTLATVDVFSSASSGRVFVRHLGAPPTACIFGITGIVTYDPELGAPVVLPRTVHGAVYACD